MKEVYLGKVEDEVKESFKVIGRFISKNHIILVMAFLILICLGPSIFPSIVVGDELWNFQNAYKLYNGGGLYTSGNTIITPLFYYLAMPIFKIFGPTIIAFRIYNALIYASLFTSIYLLFRTLKISKLKSFIYMLVGPFMVYLSTLEIGANYNILSLVFVITGIILYIKKYDNEDKKNKKYFYEIMHGINIFLIFLTKQNVLLFYTLAIVIAEFAITKNFKKAFFSLARQAIVAIALLAVFVLILLFTNELHGFINYAFLGMSEFSQNNTSFNTSFGTIQSVLMYSAIILWAVCGYLLTIKESTKIDKTKKDYIKILLLVAIATFSVVYPIGNNYHFRQAFLVSAVLIFYFFEIVVTKEFFKNSYFFVGFAVIFSLLISSYSAGKFSNWLNQEKETELAPYINVSINETTRSNILKVTKYIKEKEAKGIDVVIFSQSAAFYMMPLNKSHGAMDLPFKGNMGKGGEEKMLEDLKNLKNTEIMLVNGELFWQESEMINSYIKEHFEYLGPVGPFYVYSNTKEEKNEEEKPVENQEEFEKTIQDQFIENVK